MIKSTYQEIYFFVGGTEYEKICLYGLWLRTRG